MAHTYTAGLCALYLVVVHWAVIKIPLFSRGGLGEFIKLNLFLFLFIISDALAHF